MANSLFNFLDNLIMGGNLSDSEKTNNTIIETKKETVTRVNPQKKSTKKLTSLSYESVVAATKAGEELLNAILGTETKISEKQKQSNQSKKL